MKFILVLLVVILDIAHSKAIGTDNKNWRESKQGLPDSVIREELKRPIQSLIAKELASAIGKTDYFGHEYTFDKSLENKKESRMVACEMNIFCRVLYRLSSKSNDFGFLEGAMGTSGPLNRKIPMSFGGFDMKRGSSSEQSRGGWWTGPYGKRNKEDNLCRNKSTEQTRLDWCNLLFSQN